jgi:hypothetical protein
MPTVNLVRYGTFGGGSGGSGGPSYSMALVPGYLFLQLAHLSNASPTFRVPTVGGVAATYLGTEMTVAGSGLKSRLYGFEVTSAGTVTVEGGLSENFYSSGLLAALVTGQNSGTPYTGLTTVVANTNSIETAVSSAVGDLALMLWIDNSGQALTVGSGSTSHTGTNVGTVGAFVLSEAGASSVTIGGTFPITTDGPGFALSVVGLVAASTTSLSGSVSPINFSGAAGTNLVVRRIISPQIVNTVNGVIFTNETGITAHVYALSGELITTLAGETTNASGIMELTSALFVLGTQYRVIGVLSDGITEFYGRKAAEV